MPRRKKESKPKKIAREFGELVMACWELSPKWTIAFWAFIGVSIYDQARIFFMGHGTVYHLYVAVKSVWHLL
jgi:hypothetical protein